jgi:spore cortex formation protein SpoVR/YcgB (stage V sporulation)
MNEGFASFWHHTIMDDLIDTGYLQSGGALEFLHSHCSVLRQLDFDEKGYNGVNPYKLGYEIFNDIKRICLTPTEEDKRWFPGLIGQNWIEEIKFAAYNFKDESFILQYLSPKVIRDLKLFVVNDDAANDDLLISDIHDDDGYKEIRNKLSENYNHFANIPDIYIEGWDSRKSRTLYIVFKEKNGIKLADSLVCGPAMEHIKQLWPFKIVLKYHHTDGEIEMFSG